MKDNRRKTAAGATAKKSSAFRKPLEKKKMELLDNLGYTRFDTIAKMGRVAEEDQAQLSHEEFISLQRNSMDYEMLRLVQAALDRIDRGEYGICQDCEEPIADRRLDAIPWAQCCVRCQENHSHVDGGLIGRSVQAGAGAQTGW
jgi:DnaK suppressor protein